MYRVIEEHVCVLPDPEDFPNGTRIACTCWKTYYRMTKFWTRRPYWDDDWGW